ncbi:hypothetical protein [Celeribacter sp.]|uniref:hypothetical protein n=1 Tax=Celeribacter sp. TaxID=1890673 RepID=UPI003A8EAFD8
MMPSATLTCAECGKKAFVVPSKHGRWALERAKKHVGWFTTRLDTGQEILTCSMVCREAYQQKAIAYWINATRGWNEGHGLIVPPAIAEELRKRGFTEGFTETRPLPKE